MHQEAYEAVGRMVAAAGISNSRLRDGLDIGGANWNGHARDWMTVDRWDVLDVETPQDVDPSIHEWFAGDARAWDHPQGKKYDVILCTEVFEHVQGWELIIETAARHLKEHGVFIFTCASTGRPIHGATGAPRPEPGEWYANVDSSDILAQVGDKFFSYHVEYNSNPGDAYGYGMEVK